MNIVSILFPWVRPKKRSTQCNEAELQAQTVVAYEPSVADRHQREESPPGKRSRLSRSFDHTCPANSAIHCVERDNYPALQALVQTASGAGALSVTSFLACVSEGEMVGLHIPWTV